MPSKLPPIAAAVMIAACAAPANGEDAASPGDLPYAHGRQFSSLDAYLAFREKLGAMDMPYYQRLKDGRYRLVRGRRPSGEVYTREQLEAKFGFDEQE